MPKLIEKPTIIEAAGDTPKVIEEYAGRVNTQDDKASVALMRSPEGWGEPGQRPEFQEITVVTAGVLRVEYEDGVMDVGAGQAIVTEPGEWVRYSTPRGAEYVSICLPAFSLDAAHRDAD